jgi:hypothetical protein
MAPPPEPKPLSGVRRHAQRTLHETLHRALDMRNAMTDRHHDHHEHAPELAAVEELYSDLDAEFASPKPSSQRLHAIFDRRVRFLSMQYTFYLQYVLWLQPSVFSARLHVFC